MQDLEEQERIDVLKDWWKRWGNAISLALGITILALASWQGWRYYNGVKAREAAVAFAAIGDSSAALDAKKIRDATAVLIEKFPNTAYAPKAALLAAKVNYDGGDAKSAQAQLNWVIEHSQDSGLREIARLRLAAIAIDAKRFDEAEKLLGGAHQSAFEALFLDMRGDLALARSKHAEARAAYQAALAKFGKHDAYRQVVEVKLNALGEAS